MSDLMTKLASLVDAIYRLSRDGLLTWSEGSTPDYVQASVRNNIVELRPSKGRDGFPIMVVVVSDKLGREVHHFDDNFIGLAKPEDDMFPDYWDLLSHLYDMARMNASGMSEVIDDILTFCTELDNEQIDAAENGKSVHAIGKQMLNGPSY